MHIAFSAYQQKKIYMFFVREKKQIDKRWSKEEERKATLAIQDIVGLRFHDHTHHNHQPTTTPPCKRINCLHMLPRFDMIMIVIFPRFFRGKMKTENALKR